MQQDPSIPVDPTTATTSSDGVYVSEPPKGSGLKSILGTIGILIAAPVVALLLTAFVFQSYQVDGPSMETTLQNTDRLIVWKAPRTLARLTNHAYQPNRGDIIIFIKHGLYESGSNQEKQLIKRVIGLPGDRVVVKEGTVMVYNAEHPDGFNPDLNRDFSSTINTTTTGDVDVIVQSGEVFVCGDNRPNSLDSRSFGAISSNDIVGKLTVRIFPISKFRSFI